MAKQEKQPRASKATSASRRVPQGTAQNEPGPQGDGSEESGFTQLPDPEVQNPEPAQTGGNTLHEHAVNPVDPRTGKPVGESGDSDRK